MNDSRNPSSPRSRITRRTLLASSSAVAVSALLPNTRPLRAAPAPRKLLLVMANGGWDPTYALDPKLESSIVDSPEGAVQRFSEIDILTHPSRPSVTQFFQQHAAEVAVINGIQVRSFVHSDCIKRVLTGTPSDRKPDFAAIAAKELAEQLPIPYLVLGNSALSGPLAAITGRAGTSNQISALLATPDNPDVVLAPSGYEPSEDEQAFVDEYLTASLERMRAQRGQLGSNARHIEAFSQALERRGLVQEFSRAHAGFGERDYTPDLGVQVRVALDALEGELSHAVQLESGGWDTHQNNAEQSARHEALFASLLELFAGLTSRQLLDDTVVVVLSEMGRTPKLNQSAGKDHWPVTSAMVFGAGVRGGRVIGGTDDEQSALNVDLKSGSVTAAGTQLQTANLIAGILKLVGVDPVQHFADVEPLDALLA